MTPVPLGVAVLISDLLICYRATSIIDSGPSPLSERTPASATAALATACILQAAWLAVKSNIRKALANAGKHGVTWERPIREPMKLTPSPTCFWNQISQAQHSPRSRIGHTLGTPAHP